MSKEHDGNEQTGTEPPAIQTKRNGQKASLHFLKNQKRLLPLARITTPLVFRKPRYTKILDRNKGLGSTPNYSIRERILGISRENGFSMD